MENKTQGQPQTETQLPPIEVQQPAQPSPPPKPKPSAKPKPKVATVPPPSQPIIYDTAGAIDGGTDDESSYQAATGPVKGYVASSSTIGTKTGTPIIESPESISVVTSDQMQARAVENLAQALRYTPGVTGESFGLDNRGYGVQIRGMNDTSDTIFYRDGLSMKGAAFATFAVLDPYGAERIEVLRGPASVLYGGAEPTGIINYVSKKPTFETFREVELWGGNFDHYEGRFDLGGVSGENGKWSYRLTGVGTDSSTQVDFVDYERSFIAPALTFRPSVDTTITFLAHYQNDDQGWVQQFYPAQGTVKPNPNGVIPPSRFTGEPDHDYYDNTQYSVGYLFEHRFGPVWTIRQNARYQHLNNSQRGVFGSFLLPDLRTYQRYGDGGETDLGGFVLDNQAQAKFKTGPLAHTLLLGVDYQHYDLSDLGLEFVGPSLLLDIFDPVYGEQLTFAGLYYDTTITQQQTGLYVQDQIKIFDKLVFQLGGRRDYVTNKSEDHLADTVIDQDDDALSGRAGAVYLFDSGFAPYASYAQSFLPLLGTDLAGTPFEPETGEQYEAGLKYQPPRLQELIVTAAVFDLARQNVLTIDPENPLNSIQTGEIRSKGIELEAVASLPWGLNLQAAYTHLNTKFTKSNDGNEGNTPWAVPDDRIAVWADYTLQHGRFEGFGFGAGIRYIGETWGDDANTFTVPAVTLADAAVHYQRGNYRLALNVNNVFDEEYIAACFNFEAGCNYGQRRVVLGSLSYRW